MKHVNRHPLITYNMNRMLAARGKTEPLSTQKIDYATAVIGGLHYALLSQTQPVYEQPEHPVTGWGLVSTPVTENGTTYGIPATTFFGSRQIFLGERLGETFKVLSAIGKHSIAEEVVYVGRTNIPKLLGEDPTLYDALLAVAKTSVSEFNLDHHIHSPPTATV